MVVITSIAPKKVLISLTKKINIRHPINDIKYNLLILKNKKCISLYTGYESLIKQKPKTKPIQLGISSNKIFHDLTKLNQKNNLH